MPRARLRVRLVEEASAREVLIVNNPREGGLSERSRVEHLRPPLCNAWVGVCEPYRARRVAVALSRLAWLRRRAVGVLCLPRRASVIEVDGERTRLKVRLSHDIVAAASNEHADGAVEKSVPLDNPSAHLIVEVHALHIKGRLGRSHTIQVANVDKGVAAQHVAAVCEGRRLLAADVERARVRRLEGARIERVVLK